MASPRALLPALRLPTLLSGRRRTAAPVAAKRTARPVEATILTVDAAPKTLRIGKGVPMRIYEMTLRIQEPGRRPLEVETSRAVAASQPAPQPGAIVTAHLRGWRRKLVRVEWENAGEGSLSAARPLPGESMLLPGPQDLQVSVLCDAVGRQDIAAPTA